MRDLNLNINEIADPVAREVVQRLREYIDRDVFGNFDGKLRSFTVSAAGTWTVEHTLGFKPSDIIITSSTAGVTTVDHTASTKTTIDFTTASSGTVRLLVGEFT